MEGPQSVPYDEIEELCKIFGVKFNLYNVIDSLRNVIHVVKHPLHNCPHCTVKVTTT